MFLHHTVVSSPGMALSLQALFIQECTPPHTHRHTHPSSKKQKTLQLLFVNKWWDGNRCEMWDFFLSNSASFVYTAVLSSIACFGAWRKKMDVARRAQIKASGQWRSEEHLRGWCVFIKLHLHLLRVWKTTKEQHWPTQKRVYIQYVKGEFLFHHQCL